MAEVKMDLSENAKKLYEFLVKNGCSWEANCVEALHPKPEYDNKDPEKQKAYWQWDVNLYGNAHSRPVAGESVEFKPTANYMAEISAAYQELRKAGLAGEKNNGYNDYAYYAK